MVRTVKERDTAKCNADSRSHLQAAHLTPRDVAALPCAVSGLTPKMKKRQKLDEHDVKIYWSGGSCILNFYVPYGVGKKGENVGGLKQQSTLSQYRTRRGCHAWWSSFVHILRKVQGGLSLRHGAGDSLRICGILAYIGGPLWPRTSVLRLVLVSTDGAVLCGFFDKIFVSGVFSGQNSKMLVNRVAAVHRPHDQYSSTSSSPSMSADSAPTSS